MGPQRAAASRQGAEDSRPRHAHEGTTPRIDARGSSQAASGPGGLLALQRAAGNRAVQRLVQREGDGSWWDKAVSGYKKVEGIKDDPRQSWWDSYKQWNNALTGKAGQAEMNQQIEGFLDESAAKDQRGANDWVDKNTDEDSWWRTAGHGPTDLTRGLTDYWTGLISGGLSAGEGMLNTAAHPIDAAVDVGEMAIGQAKPMGDLAGNLVSVATGDQTLEGAGKDLLKDEAASPIAKMLQPFAEDLGHKDEKGNWDPHVAKALGRGAGMIGVGALGGKGGVFDNTASELAGESGGLTRAGGPRKVFGDPAIDPAAPTERVPATLRSPEPPTIREPGVVGDPAVDPGAPTERGVPPTQRSPQPPLEPGQPLGDPTVDPVAPTERGVPPTQRSPQWVREPEPTPPGRKVFGDPGVDPAAPTERAPTTQPGLGPAEPPPATQRSPGQPPPEALPETRPAPGSEALPETQPVPGSEALPETQPAPSSESLPETQPAPGSKGLPETQPAPGSEGLPETQPAPGSEGLPETQPRPEAGPSWLPDWMKDIQRGYQEQPPLSFPKKWWQ